MVVVQVQLGVLPTLASVVEVVVDCALLLVGVRLEVPLLVVVVVAHLLLGIFSADHGTLLMPFLTMIVSLPQISLCCCVPLDCYCIKYDV